ncbi:hypothetical protein CHUAL_013330 [Chamberlinius hualienensis]
MRNPSTKEERYDSSKTQWPVAISEAMFLPEFPIKGAVTESSFLIEGFLAKGAFGTVLKVVKKDTEVTYVMKILSKSRIITENAVQQCKDEVQIQLRCGQHPFIVNCQFHWQNKKYLFLVNDYVPNGELLQLWKKLGKIPEDLVLILVAEMAIALDYLHNTGIIHRDLKMENILLDSDGHVQLIDFGLSKWLQIGSRAKTMCGTIQYMAPEIINSETYNHAVDWWCLGIITYCLLMGKYPINSVRDHHEMADRMSKFDYGVSNEHTAGIRLLVQKLLCKDPMRRLQTLKQLRWEPCFASFNFDRIRTKQVSLRELLEKNVQNGQISLTSENENLINHEFKDFDWNKT